MSNDDNKKSGTDLPLLAPLSYAESSRRLRDMLGTIDPAELGEYQLVRRSDISLAAQMLTWGSEDGLTTDQQHEVRAQSEKLAAIAEADAPATFFNGGDSEREFAAAGADEDIHPLRGPRPSDWALARVFWNCMAYVPGVVPQTLSTEFLLRDARKLDAERPPLPKMHQSLKEYLAGNSNLPSPSAAAIVVAFYEASRAFPLATALYWSHWVVERARQLDAEWAADPLKRLPLTEQADFVAVPRVVLESIRDSSACTSARGFAAGALAEHDERKQFQAPAARGDATSPAASGTADGAQRAAAAWLLDVDDEMVKRFCDGADDAFGWSPTGRELVRKGLEAALRPIAARREDIHPDVYDAAWAAFQAAPTDALRAAVCAALKTAFPRKPLSGGDGDG